jgi:hypothetical protein
MEISQTSKITPDGPPTRPDDAYVWTELVPCLLSPGALAIIRALLRAGRSLPLREIAKTVGLSTDHTHHHCKAMECRGVLETVQLLPRAEGDGDEPSYFFPKPPQASPSPSLAASA